MPSQTVTDSIDSSRTIDQVNLNFPKFLIHHSTVAGGKDKHTARSLELELETRDKDRLGRHQPLRPSPSRLRAYLWPPTCQPSAPHLA